ncbi:MAG: low molecular weight phosphatase family protein [Planctomycetota bacterium]|jgi:protein-tyrosine-phosphatase|nr:low molecular weight phosphatase family protein [Planctomycetota bacterium]
MDIACVCTGNTCRSPMLAALLRRELAQRGLDGGYQVTSAGVAAGTGDPATGHAVTCMAERGIDISSHASQNVMNIEPLSVGLFLCMGNHHGHMLLELGVPAERIVVVGGDRGGVPDPYGGDLATYSATAAVLAEAARDVAQSLQAQTGD